MNVFGRCYGHSYLVHLLVLLLCLLLYRRHWKGRHRHTHQYSEWKSVVWACQFSYLLNIDLVDKVDLEFLQVHGEKREGCNASTQ